MLQMKKFICVALVALQSVVSFAQNNIVDEVVWVVGDEAILRSEVERIRNDYGSNISGNPYCVIPEQLAVQKLFLHQAELDSITVSDSQVNQSVEAKINERVLMAGSKEKLEEYMRMPMKQIREELYEQIRAEMLTQEVRRSLTKDVKVNPAGVGRQ